MKRYIYIIIGIVVAAIIAIIILFFLKGGSALSGLLPASITGSLPSVGTQGSNGSGGTTGFGSSTTGGTIGSIGQSGLVKSFNIVSNGPILDYFVDTQGKITAIQPSGEVITVSGNQSSTISSNQIGGIISASFSYDGKKILVSFGDPSDPEAAVFDVTSSTWTALPQGLFSPQWSPSNYQIAFLNEYGSGVAVLDTIDATNPNKPGVTALLSLNATDLSLQWISKNQFVLSDKPSVQTTGSSWLYNSQSKTLVPIEYEMLGPESVWDESATTTLGLAYFETSNSQRLKLQLVDASGNDVHDLSFLTLPTKCLFNDQTSTVALATTTSALATTTASSSPAVAASTVTSTPFLYCGVPSDPNQLSSAQLPDDYNDGALFTSDEIIKLNADTGALSTLWNDSTQNVDATDLKFFNNSLFLINRYDQKLYSLTFAQ
jgi:hypothetical protein